MTKILFGGEEVKSGRGGSEGGTWRRNGGTGYLPRRIDQRVLAGEPLRLRAFLEVFETSMPGGHLRMPDSGDFKVLWEGAAEGRWPASPTRG